MSIENNQNLGEKKILSGGYSYEMLPQDIKDNSRAKIAKLIYKEQEPLNKIDNKTEQFKRLAKVIPLMTGAVVYKADFNQPNRA